jgi:hypothetical protein
MNIEKIREVVNSPLPAEYQEKAILAIIADDKKVLPYMMQILQNEREQKEELILDTNLELSRALVTMNANPTGEVAKRVHKEQHDFVVGEIKKHYIKWKDTIKCCFNVQGLP